MVTIGENSGVFLIFVVLGYDKNIGFLSYPRFMLFMICLGGRKKDCAN